MAGYLLPIPAPTEGRRAGGGSLFSYAFPAPDIAVLFRDSPAPAHLSSNRSEEYDDYHDALLRAGHCRRHCPRLGRRQRRAPAGSGRRPRRPGVRRHGPIEVVAELAQLVGRTGDTETQKWLNTAFVAASSLQNNYYETRMPENLVRSGVRLGEELSQRLYQLFWPEGALAPARTIGVMSTMATTTPYPAPDIAAAVARGLATASDRPQPDLDGNRSAQKYAGMARDFRVSAWEHLNKGDLAQASNKAWRLVAETVKAISAQHGGVIHTHRAIVEVAGELARLVGNAGDMETRVWLNTVFVTALAMHINFYENELPEETVRDSIVSCVGLSRRFYELFWPEGAAPADDNI